MLSLAYNIVVAYISLRHIYLVAIGILLALLHTVITMPRCLLRRRYYLRVIYHCYHYYCFIFFVTLLLRCLLFICSLVTPAYWFIIIGHFHIHYAAILLAAPLRKLFCYCLIFTPCHYAAIIAIEKAIYYGFSIAIVHLIDILLAMVIYTGAEILSIVSRYACCYCYCIVCLYYYYYIVTRHCYYIVVLI